MLNRNTPVVPDIVFSAHVSSTGWLGREYTYCERELMLGPARKCHKFSKVTIGAQTASFELKNFILGVDKASMACYTFNPWDTSNYTLDNKEPFILANQVQAKVMIVKYPCMDSAAILGTTDRNTEKLDRERIVMVDPLVVMVTLTHVESVGVGYTRKMVIIARRDCGVPALTGLPCHHNVAHARFAGLDWQKFVDPLKTVAGWKAQYPLDLHFADVPNLTEAHGCA
ncbi:hypothetical protein CYMTET_8197 [Cymbomonas tetramitiformis]|uniref:Uncharacterized protein n=1 Tax=Cymbomonas tetramitiformis TaxID=36881 RepID=A0AAE0GTI8_9CHLO|nr:hypothetical protein CYMTET_8197 [Cymbomonas tetramitiformis]